MAEETVKVYISILGDGVVEYNMPRSKTLGELKDEMVLNPHLEYRFKGAPVEDNFDFGEAKDGDYLIGGMNVKGGN